MNLGYVKSAFKNVAAANKHSAIKVVELGSNSSCRVLFVQFFPAAISAYGDEESSYADLEVYSGDPASGGSLMFTYRASSDSYGSKAYNYIRMWESPRIPDPGVKFDDDVWVKSPDTDLEDPTAIAVGINFVSIIYQVGSQGS